ncbi:MAG: hypothetical protein AAF328_00545 [Planctomycetota bacterium]
MHRSAWASWLASAADVEIDAAIRALYAELDERIAARGPTCWQSGKCCNFGAYGHRLYVSALEVAWFLRQVGKASETRQPIDKPMKIALPQAATSDVCPFQIEGACSTHAVRPLGCRIFFCQAGTEAWQQELYEQYLGRLQKLHERRNIPYRYADWLALLEEFKVQVGPARKTL